MDGKRLIWRTHDGQVMISQPDGRNPQLIGFVHDSGMVEMITIDVTDEELDHVRRLPDVSWVGPLLA